MARERCPTSAELTAFVQGDLPETALDDLAAHLEHCPHCEALAQTLDHATDPAQAALRRAARAEAGPNVPERVGDFEILGALGRGGMGQVYRARHTRLRRTVALKMLRAGAFADPEECRRFRAEAEAVARLQHPQIVQIFEVGEWPAGDGVPPVPYFVLELVDGGSLAARTAGRPQPPRQAAAWLEPLARAVHYAHGQGIVHRDLKPSNVLLTADGTPKLCDFGVAKLLEGHEDQTRTGVVLGTAEYMAPEQAERALGPVGPASDIYGLGAILYELLTGRPPFDGPAALDVVRRVLSEEVLSPRQLQPGLPRDLVTICLKCLEKEPSRRYATAQDLADDLRRFLGREPIRARPVGAAGRLVRWCRRRPLLAALSAALALSVAGGLGATTTLWLREAEARRVAVGEKEKADGERARALQLAGELGQERDAAEWQAYRAKLAAAAGALRLDNVFTARGYLEAAPVRHRDWEWYHYASQLDQAQAVYEGHRSFVRFVAFTPDGRLVSGGPDGTVRVWDTATGKTALVADFPGQLLFFALSPDGTRVACSDAAGTVYLRHLPTGQSAVIPGTPGQLAYFLAFSPDGARLAVGWEAGKVSLHDAATGRERLALRPGVGPHGLTYRPLAFSPDGRSFAVGVSDGTVRLWGTADGRLGEPARDHQSLPVVGAFSPDGKRLATAGQHADDAVILWEVGAARPLSVQRRHRNQVVALAFSRDGARLVSTSQDTTAQLWDGRTGEPLATLRGHTAGVNEALFTPDGRRLVTTSEDQTLRVWDTASGLEIGVLRGHTGPVRFAALSPDGARVASAAGDQVVRVWSVDAAGRNRVLAGHTDAVRDVAFSPDGTRLLSASPDQTLRFWDVTSGRLVRSLRHPAGSLRSAALSPDGKRAVSVGRGGAYLWDLAADPPGAPFPLPAGSGSYVRCAFRPGGARVAAAGEDGAVYLWDVPGGRPAGVLRGHDDAVYDVAFSPDGGRLASAGAAGVVRLWDVPADGGPPAGPVAALRYGAPACSVAFSADGRLLAAGGMDQVVRLWDVRTLAELPPVRTDGAALAVRFHPGGTRLAVGCADGLVRLYDVATHEEVAALRGHEHQVNAVAFSPDGRRLASGSTDSTVRVWDTQPPAGAPRRGAD